MTSRQRPSAVDAVDKFVRGAKAYVEGRLSTSEWTGQDGKQRFGLSVMSWHTRLAQIGRQKVRREREKPQETVSEAGGNTFYNDDIPFSPEVAVMIPSDAIATARSVRIEDEVARRGVRLRGRVEMCGPCPRCGGDDRFSINVRKQVFNCRNCERGGDVVAFVQMLDACTFAEAVETLAGGSIRRPQIKPQERAAKQQTEIEYERRQAEKAQWLWLQRARIKGTPAERYLREARGYAGPLPATLGFLPPSKPEHHPAMIAAFDIPQEPEPGVIGDPSGVSAVHLTLLRPNGFGKADISPNKLIIGRPLNRPIVLAPPNDLLGLAITEGIEDALSVREATGLGAWAAGAASFMSAFGAVVPDYIDCVTIYAYRDQAGQNGAHKLAEALHDRCIEILIEGLL